MAKEIMIGIVFVLAGLGVGLWAFQSQEQNAVNVVYEANNVETTASSAGVLPEGTAKTSTTPIVLNDQDLKVIESQDVREAIKVSLIIDDSKDNRNYEKAIQLLNEDPDNNLRNISAYLNGLKANEDGLRGHLINLAMQTNADPSVKGELLRDYLTKAEFVVTENDLANNSVSAITAIDYMGQLFKTKEEAGTFVADINDIQNERVKEEFIKRVKIYYQDI